MATPSSVFLTGATGFVGRRVLARLAQDAAVRVTALVRGTPPQLPVARPDWRFVRGDLADPAVPLPIERGQVVLHLAAVTGKARPEEYFRVNARGTERLALASREAGAARLVCVSSVAAGFADQRRYPYAWSKVAAERAAARSGVPAVIVRPTMVLGAGSPVARGLEQLACAPVPVVFGAGARLVQPVSVDDLVTVLLAIAAEPDLAGQTIDVGGPERLTMGDLLLRVRRAHGLPARPLLHLPLTLARLTLAALEPPLFPLLPLTAGQLASFANDGTARPHPLVGRFAGQMQTVDEMVGMAAHD